MIVVADQNGQPERKECASLSHKYCVMSKANLFMEVVEVYRKHGWTLDAALLQSATKAELLASRPELLSDVVIKESNIDALWFTRPSHQERVAWELRLLAETQYALFETFEKDETEEQREEMKLEMEARLRDYALGSSGERGH